MEKTVFSFIQKNELLHKGAKVLVGVSGGPDSMALLYFLHRIQKEWDLDIVVLSVDHQLRGKDSVQDVAYVEEMAKSWGLHFNHASLNVPKHEKQKKVSTEVAARELRYQFFKEKMGEYDADYLALGHHGDDQIETLVMKLVRSASSTAFTGIPVKRSFAGGEIIRPLLCVSRKEIETYCATNQIEPRIDQTNFETAHTRNYYRNLVLPLLKEKNNHLHRTVQHLSETLQEDEKYLEKQAEEAFRRAATFYPDERKVVVDIHLFLQYDYPLQRRAYKLILNYLYETLPDRLSYIHEEQFFFLIKGQEGNVQIDFPQGLKLYRSYRTLTFYFVRENVSSSFFQQHLLIPGMVEMPDGSVIKSTLSNRIEEQDRFTCYFNINEVEFPLQVRTRKPGDRMTWEGLNGTKKLKDLFIDLKVAQNERDAWPLVVDNQGKILWLVGLKKAMRPDEKKNEWICLQYYKANWWEE